MKKRIAKFLNRILAWLGEDKNPKQVKEENRDIVVPISHDPGLICPQCNNKIQVSIPMLLSGQSFHCNKCFLQISIDKDKSSDSLIALNKLQENFNVANKIINENS